MDTAHSAQDSHHLLHGARNGLAGRPHRGRAQAGLRHSPAALHPHGLADLGRPGGTRPALLAHTPAPALPPPGLAGLLDRGVQALRGLHGQGALLARLPRLLSLLRERTAPRVLARATVSL